MKKVWKTTRQFRYDLNKIPYDYTIEMRYRCKSLHLVEKVFEEIWTKVCNIVQEAVTKTNAKENRCKKAKWLCEEALPIAMERRETKSKGERERHTQLNAEFQRTTRRNKKGFLNEQCKETEENNRMGKTRDSSRKLEIWRMGTTDRNGKDLK